MNVGGIDSSRIQSMLTQLKAITAENADASSKIGSNESSIGIKKGKPSGGVDFASALRSSLDQVNESQSTAKSLGEKFSLGDASVNLSDVMIAGQKASIAFQGTVQVRNKLVSAYQTIMNMQV